MEMNTFPSWKVMEKSWNFVFEFVWEPWAYGLSVRHSNVWKEKCNKSAESAKKLDGITSQT